MSKKEIPFFHITAGRFWCQLITRTVEALLKRKQLTNAKCPFSPVKGNVCVVLLRDKICHSNPKPLPRAIWRAVAWEIDSPSSDGWTSFKRQAVSCMRSLDLPSFKSRPWTVQIFWICLIYLQHRRCHTFSQMFPSSLGNYNYRFSVQNFSKRIVRMNESLGPSLRRMTPLGVLFRGRV
jgi:hypothetical protein